MSDLQQAIDKLRSSPHYKELAAYEPPFNPFEIAGVAHRELTHSSVLAWLLRDEANREFRQIFVTWIRDRVRGVRDRTVAEAKKINDDWDKFVVPGNPEDSSLKPKIVKTEKGDKTSRIDVFAHFESLKLVIGIEVKVWADEQPDQVERYQGLLCKDYPSYKKVKKVVVFLTPTGWEPETADKDNLDVPVLAMSWGFVSKIIREMRSALGNENDFRMQFLQHLERNITMNETEEQRMVRELLSEDNNLEMIGRIIDNMSSLQTSLEYKFWTELRKQLQDRDQLQLQDEGLEFQLYKSNSLEAVYVPPKRLEERIRSKDKWLGLTFRIPDSSEVVCRITHDKAGHVYYGFVLCKRENIRERVKIQENNDEKHKEYLCRYRKKHGPDVEHGWLGWYEYEPEKVSITVANEPNFDTLVKIKKNQIVEKLVDEICKVIDEISE